MTAKWCELNHCDYPGKLLRNVNLRIEYTLHLNSPPAPHRFVGFEEGVCIRAFLFFRGYKCFAYAFSLLTREDMFKKTFTLKYHEGMDVCVG